MVYNTLVENKLISMELELSRRKGKTYFPRNAMLASK